MDINEKGMAFVEFLVGTCKTIYDAEYELDLDSNEKGITDIIDDHIFECECCGWWLEMSEMSEKDWICYDCDE